MQFWAEPGSICRLHDTQPWNFPEAFFSLEGVSKGYLSLLHFKSPVPLETLSST